MNHMRMYHGLLEIVAPEVNRELVFSEYHTTVRPCPKCGYATQCNGVSKWRCCRCGWAEERDVRKYRSLVVKEPGRKREAFLYGRCAG